MLQQGAGTLDDDLSSAPGCSCLSLQTTVTGEPMYHIYGQTSGGTGFCSIDKRRWPTPSLLH